jgi:hypothetical protein
MTELSRCPHETEQNERMFGLPKVHLAPTRPGAEAGRGYGGSARVRPYRQCAYRLILHTNWHNWNQSPNL